ncbi:peptidylprolyl isomerase [Primorskyibacter flagellatus]|uniref:Parvulin-like PPIase n=1 Tax=Primorskyibacter flagellatus TaxID=1387277 RepID=A0A1W2AKS2_9RHOB|nr:peptidylprolyl isomerase [Primorskyibacter flagellatus]SMC60848.1 peptidyl-prolyl cis-trans isomerase C [Primorskyibacter flagellatus]
MPKHLTKLSTIALICMMGMPLQAQDTPSADTVVATVNGTEITLGHMIMVRATLPEQYQQMPADALFDGILEQLVQQETLAQSDDATETRRVKIALDNERRTLLASEVIEMAATDAVTDEALQSAYDAKYVGAEMGDEFNAAHILVETEEEAAALVEELNGGADFAELARENSTGPSGPNGGELGWFSAGMMVEPFQAAVEGMENGTISDPVQTQFGWHVIKLIETRTKSAPELDAVREELSGTIQRAAVEAKIAELVDAAEITRTDKAELDTEALNDLSLLED